MEWWNSRYSIRKNIIITNEGTSAIPSGSPIYVKLDFIKMQNQNKIRDDFEDIEILYWDDTIATPAWSLISRDTEYDEDTGELTVIFNTEAEIDLEEENTSYYLYFCNPNLKNVTTRPTYSSAEYSQEATSDSNDIMFTRPTEDWINGQSTVSNARAAFAFYGRKAKVYFETGEDHGILALKVNNENELIIDTYATITSDALVYTFDADAVQRHYLRFRATGSKNPSSTSTSIKIAKVLYSKYTGASLDIEEIYSTQDSLTVLVGS